MPKQYKSIFSKDFNGVAALSRALRARMPLAKVYSNAALRAKIDRLGATGPLYWPSAGEYAFNGNCYSYARDDGYRGYNPGHIAAEAGKQMTGLLDYSPQRSFAKKVKNGTPDTRKNYWKYARGKMEAWKRAVISDGWIPATKQEIRRPKTGFYAVAMVGKAFRTNYAWVDRREVKTGESREADYHFYRLNRDGRWSHRRGNNDPTLLDHANRPIKNPEKANRGDYKRFLGYFWAPCQP